MVVLLSFGWESVLYLVLGIVGGLVAGYFISRAEFIKQLEKNPPIIE